MASLPARSTRQLLGELDALMDQMLSLPVEEGAEPRTATLEPPPTPSRPTALAIPRPQPKPPVHPLAVTMTLIDAPPETDEVVSDERRRLSPPDSDNTTDASSPAGINPAARPEETCWVEESDLVPDPSPRPIATRAPSRSTTALVPVPSRPLVVAPPPPIVPLPGRPIRRGYGLALRLNRMLARRTYGLGFLGRLVRSDVGRALLGVLGILMMLIAAGWLLKDLLHWT